MSPSSKSNRSDARTLKGRSADFVIRAHEASDFDELYELDQQCFPRGIAYSRSMLRYFLQIAPQTCFVAEMAGTVAGFILGEVDRPYAHTVTLDVSDRQRRSGVGSALLSTLEEAFERQGAATVVLETAVNNAAAIALWQRHGYQATRRLKKYYLGRTDAHEMRKHL